MEIETNKLDMRKNSYLYGIRHIDNTYDNIYKIKYLLMKCLCVTPMNEVNFCTRNSAVAC